MHPSSYAGSAGPLFSQSSTHTPPSAVGRRLSAHRSRWQVRMLLGGTTHSSRATSSSRRAVIAAANGAPADSQPADQRVPALGADGLDVPRRNRAVLDLRVRDLVDRRNRCADQAGVQCGVGIQQVDPLVDAYLGTPPSVGEHLARRGAVHTRRRDAGGVRRLVELGGRAHLVHDDRPERHLHREPTAVGLQAPDRALLPSRHRLRGEPGIGAQPEGVGDPASVHRTPQSRPGIPTAAVRSS